MNKHMGRRYFLKFSGTCVMAAIVGTGCTRTNQDQASAAMLVCPYGLSYDPYPGQCVNYVDNNGSGFCDLSEGSNPADEAQTETPAATTTQEATQTAPAQTPTIVSQKDAALSSAELVVLCHLSCRYPGHCNRFRDQDGSGVCDLSEGIDPADLGSN
jgi:hypothetical protein